MLTNNYPVVLLALVGALCGGPGAHADLINLSTEATETLGGLTFDDGSVAEYNAVLDTATLVFAESLFSGDEDLDALFIKADGKLILSTTGDATLGGLTFRDGDLAEYDPGTDTATLFFSEDLFSAGEDVDAFHLLSGGTLLLSTEGDATLGGLTFRDGDLVEYDAGTDTATLYFSEDLFSAGEDIDAVTVLPNGNIVLSTEADATLGGLTFRDGDLAEYDPSSDTATLFLSEDLFSDGADIDAVHIAVVPEPSSILMLAAFMLLGLLHRMVLRT